MEIAILTFCATFILILVIYWIMPINKMKEVNKALTSLLQILPITKIIEGINSDKK
ncbi:hypothetical protein C7447_10523 [Tenacibaculum adriaticum]|uniref:Uncharacterized protein n=1 Tax=Tenacibaculum adriaticum TaxID=413713 RepID=A0A5S5DM47_9FLAO|nr:hypothetical protein C7447_10523 [Tenacibaculum adriaticum]